MTDKKETKKNSKKKKNILKTLSKNNWAIATIALSVLLVTTLVVTSLGYTIGIGSEKAGQKVLEFANSQGANAELVSSESNGEFYEVVLSIQGQNVPVYISRNGKNFIPSITPLTAKAVQTPSTQATTESVSVTPDEIPKSDKPVVEAFVMSHCPYGTQAEKGIVPVMKLLDDKIDAEIKFVYYAMHPSYGEVEEQLNQYCIQEEQNDKFIDYLTCFLGKTGAPEDGEACLDEIGIDKAKLETCVTTTDSKFNVIANLEDESSWLSGRYPKFDIHKAENEAYGVGGSPTLVINGIKIEAQDTNGDGRGDTYVFNDQSIPFGRSAETYKQIICSLFNEAPKECNEDLSSLGSPAPGFGFDTQGGATTAQCG